MVNMDYVTTIILSSCYLVILCMTFVLCMCSINKNDTCLCYCCSIAAQYGIHATTCYCHNLLWRYQINKEFTRLQCYVR